MEVSAENKARRVQRPLPYDHSLPKEMLLRLLSVSSVLPDRPSPYAGSLSALKQVLARQKGGETITPTPLDAVHAGALQRWREALRDGGSNLDWARQLELDYSVDEART